MIPTLLASVILIFSVWPAVAQTSTAAVNRSEQRLAIASSDTGRPSVSAQSRAEAKRLYKDGVKYVRGGLYKQAIQIFARAIELDPEYVDAYYGLGYSYFELGQLQKASESLRELLRLNPKDDEGRLLLARVEETSQRQNELQPLETVPVSTATEPAKEVPVAANVASDTATPNTNENIDESLTRIYRVGAGDVLDVRLTDDPTNRSTLFTVTSLGLLEHPSLPDPLPVAGLTVEEITAALKADFRRRGLNDDMPIRVGVRDYGSHVILVSGLVKEAGTKIIRREAIPLYVVVADAQPLPEAATLSLVRSKSKESLTIDLIDTKRMDQLVFPGDVITFHPNITQFFYVSGEVKSPGEKTFRRGLSLTQALMTAGGLTPKAKEARVSRDDGSGFLTVTRYKLKEIESGKLRDPLIQPGDRITVVD